MISALNGASQLLVDVHHSISNQRRFLITSEISAETKKVALDSKLGKNLFGDDLLARIKSSDDMRKICKTFNPALPKTNSNPKFDGASVREERM
jgi:hypothetical protein